MERDNTEIDLSQQFFPNEEYMAEAFDREILLYATTKSSGVYLNETAYLVWQLCGQGKTAGEIISLLEKNYPSETSAIHSDVTSAIRSLVECGALLVSTS